MMGAGVGGAVRPRDRERAARGVGLSRPFIFGPGELNCKRSISDVSFGKISLFGVRGGGWRERTVNLLSK